MSRWVGRGVLIAVLVIGLVAVYVVASIRDGSGRGDVTSTVDVPTDMPKEWVSLGEVPLSPRKVPLALMSAEYAFVIGGHEQREQLAGNQPMDDGAYLELASGKWRELPRLPQPLANPDGVVADDRLLVAGVSCGSFDAEGGLDTCEPGQPTIFALSLEDIEAGWKPVPAELEKDSIPKAIGSVRGAGVFQTSAEGEIVVIPSDGSKPRFVPPPAPLERGRICASGEIVTAVDVRDIVSAENEVSPPPGEGEFEDPSPDSIKAARLAWSFSPASQSEWADPATSTDDVATSRALVPLCASGGAIVADTAGENAAYFDAETREWMTIESLPLALSVGARPLVALSTAKTLLVLEDIAGHRQVEFDRANARWVEVELPSPLSTQRPRAVSANGATAVLIAAEGGTLELWARSFS